MMKLDKYLLLVNTFILQGTEASRSLFSSCQLVVTSGTVLCLPHRHRMVLESLCPVSCESNSLGITCSRIYSNARLSGRRAHKS